MIELVLESPNGLIKDLASTVGLPGYDGVLRALLVGRALDEVGGAVEAVRCHVQGPLQRPTVAALASAMGAGCGPWRGTDGVLGTPLARPAGADQRSSGSPALEQEGQDR